MKGPLKDRTYVGINTEEHNEYGTHIIPSVVVLEGTGEDEERVRRPLPAWDDDGHDAGNPYEPGMLTWGYNGSGPHDLAYNLLADVLGEEWATPGQRRRGEPVAWKLHHQFVGDYVCRWPGDKLGIAWRLDATEVIGWLHRKGITWAGTDLSIQGPVLLHPLPGSVGDRCAWFVRYAGHHYYAECDFAYREQDDHYVDRIMVWDEDEGPEPLVVENWSVFEAAHQTISVGRIVVGYQELKQHKPQPVWVGVGPPVWASGEVRP